MSSAITWLNSFVDVFFGSKQLDGTLMRFPNK